MWVTAQLQTVWRALIGRDGRDALEAEGVVVALPRQQAVDPVEIAPNDPIVAYFQGATGAVDVDGLNLDSPAVRALKTAGVKLALPLVSQGEVIGVLNLGLPLSGQDYSADDHKLLHDLATQAAPAVRVAQLVRQQHVEAQSRERLEQEMRVAQIIQQTLLPQTVPDLPGWQVTRHYKPAREVGGDFYDFLQLPGGKLGLVVGDVTDKGVPAAMVMATTRAILHETAESLGSPGQVLQRVNEVLHPDIPPNMFVTCIYAILDPDSGRLVYANAGHCLPCLRCSDGVNELRATGMPLGLMPGMTYEEKERSVLPGESVLFYSDGLVEAHNSEREMFGLPRLHGLLTSHPGGAPVIDFLLNELTGFTGVGWEQEDDITLVTLQRSGAVLASGSPASKGAGGNAGPAGSENDEPHVLAEFSLPSEVGNERQAAERVAAAVEDLGLPETRLERLKTAVGEATMNGMEHGNEYRPDLPVSIRVQASSASVSVYVTDHGGGAPIPQAESPDLDAKLAGTQSPRGWGLFLIKNMVDEVRVTSDKTHHTVELIMQIGGGDIDGQAL